MNSRVRCQASSDAAWNSSCLRSKKLCGAPSNSISSYSLPASRSACSKATLSSWGMPWSAPPCRARIGALEARHEVDHPARPPVEADGAREPVPPGGRRPGAAAAETEADREDRRAAEVAEVADARADVGLHLLVRELLHERHVVPVVRPLVDAGGAAEIVEGDRGVAALGEAQRELLVEAVEAADVRQDHDAGRDFSVRHRPERGEAVAVLARQDEVVVGDGGARDPRDRRLGVEVEAHGSRAYERRRGLCGVP